MKPSSQALASSAVSCWPVLAGVSAGLPTSTDWAFGASGSCRACASAPDRAPSPRITARNEAALRIKLIPYPQWLADCAEMALSCHQPPDGDIMSLVGKLSNPLREPAG